MNNLLAREVQVSDLTSEQVAKLHSLEIKLGRILTPYEINHKGNLRDHGTMDEGQSARLGSVLYAIYNKYVDRAVDEVKMGGDGLKDMLEVYHHVDLEARKQGLSYTKDKEDMSLGVVRGTRKQKMTEFMPF